MFCLVLTLLSQSKIKIVGLLSKPGHDGKVNSYLAAGDMISTFSGIAALYERPFRRSQTAAATQRYHFPRGICHEVLLGKRGFSGLAGRREHRYQDRRRRQDGSRARTNQQRVVVPQGV
jgi:hypothetical protein